MNRPYDALSDSQKTTAKRGIVGIFALGTGGFLSYAGLAVYIATSEALNWFVFLTWFLMTHFVVRIGIRAINKWLRSWMPPTVQ